MLLIVILTLTHLLSSCQTTQVKEKYPRNALVNQILKFRKSKDGLTNRACEQWTEEGDCIFWHYLEYDLTNMSTRKMLRDLKFICKIAGERFKIKLEQAVFERDDFYRCGFLKLKTCVNKKIINVTDKEMLINADTVCFSESSYDFGDM